MTAPLSTILSRGCTKFTPNHFNDEEDNLSILQNEFRVLVIGAGNLGCEIIKNLIHSGFKDIEIVDKARINCKGSNLIFRSKHNNRSKAEIVKNVFMKKYCSDSNNKLSLTSHQKDIAIKERYSEFYIESSFYTKFDFIIVALKSIQTKAYFNQMINDLITYEYDDIKKKHIVNNESIIPWIDAYSYNSLNGDISVFLPTMTPCFECNLSDKMKTFNCKTDKYGQIKTYQQIKHSKYISDIRKAIHEFNLKVNYQMALMFDSYNMQHIDQLYHEILTIPENNRLSKGVIPKHFIIKTVQNLQNDHNVDTKMNLFSTYSIIAGIVCNEVFKLITGCSLGLNNRFKYNGYDISKCQRLQQEKKSFCKICGLQRIYCLKEGMKTFQDLFNRLAQNIDEREILCIAAGDQTLYHRGRYLKEMYDDNFDKKIYELTENGNIVHCIYSGKLVKEFVVDWTEYIVTGWTKENIELKYDNLIIPYAVQLLIARFIECDSKPML